MMRFILYVVVAAVFFAGGYFVGARNQGQVEQKLSNAQVIVASSKDKATEKLDEVLLKLRLAEVRQKITEAKSLAQDKNFAAASQELQGAKTTLDSLLGDVKEDLRKEFTPVVVTIDEAKMDLDKSDEAATTKLETLKTQVGEIWKKMP